jgi:hypothetical protein
MPLLLLHSPVNSRFLLISYNIVKTRHTIKQITLGRESNEILILHTDRPFNHLFASFNFLVNLT